MRQHLGIAILLFVNGLMSLALPMLILLGALGGALLAPAPALATLPSTFQVFAGIVFSAPIAIFMGKFGRLNGLLLGGGAIVLGGALGGLALSGQNFALLLSAHFVLGSGMVAFGYLRFAVAERARSDQRSVVVSLATAVGLVGAVAGPRIFELTRNLLPETVYAGGYITLALLGLAGLLILVGARKFLRATTTPALSGPTSPSGSTGRSQLSFAIFSAALAQAVMVFAMTATPVGMALCGYGPAEAASVVGAHVFAMFAPSLLSGLLIKRLGAPRVIVIGMIVLVLGGVAATLGQDLSNFFLSLILIGLGWNAAYVGSSTILAEAAPTAGGHAAQGANDTLIALCSVLASFASGATLSVGGWHLVGMLTIVSLLMGCSAMLWLSYRTGSSKAVT